MVNIDILKHFDETVDTKGIKIFTLKESERATFFNKLPYNFRCMYLSDDDLNWRVSNFSTNRFDEIKEKIPDNPVIMSGEFAEILGFYLIPEKYIPLSNLRPPKWRWKESRNIPAHFTDIILFNRVNETIPSNQDAIISIESKARAGKPNTNESALEKAIKDALKDSISRLAESLFHLKTKYKDDKNIEAINKLERFIDAAKHPPYEKHFKAVATVDNNFSEIHINNVQTIPSGIQNSFEVILVRLENLKEGYETTYQKMLMT